MQRQLTDGNTPCHSTSSSSNAHQPQPQHSCPSVDVSPQYVIDTETGNIRVACVKPGLSIILCLQFSRQLVTKHLRSCFGIQNNNGLCQ